MQPCATAQRAITPVSRGSVDGARLEAFSDGVFAVAITLLALDLAVPGPGHGPLPGQLVERWPSFAAFLVSFLTIGIVWVNHHTLFKNFAGIDRPLMFLNLLLLLFVVSVPFATRTAADYLTGGGLNAGVAVAVYQGVFLGLGLAFGSLFWWSVAHEHLKVPLTRARARTAVIRFGAGNVFYAIGIGMAFVSPTASLAIAGLIAVYYAFEQTPSIRPGPA